MIVSLAGDIYEDARHLDWSEFEYVVMHVRKVGQAYLEEVWLKVYEGIQRGKDRGALIFVEDRGTFECKAKADGKGRSGAWI